MNRLVITVFALTVSASCGGEKKEQPQGAGAEKGGSPQGGGGPSAALTCAQVAEKAVGGLGPGGGPVKDKLRPLYEKRCTDDKWPAEAMECFAKAEGMPALKQCRERLPEVAKQNLIDQIRMVMTAQGGGMGGPPRGHGSDGSGGSGSGAPSAGSGSGSATPSAGSGSGSATPSTGSGSGKAGSAAGSGSAAKASGSQARSAGVLKVLASQGSNPPADVLGDAHPVDRDGALSKK